MSSVSKRSLDLVGLLASGLQPFLAWLPIPSSPGGNVLCLENPGLVSVPWSLHDLRPP